MIMRAIPISPTHSKRFLVLNGNFSARKRLLLSDVGRRYKDNTKSVLYKASPILRIIEL